MSPQETICIKYQILFSGKNEKNIINLLSAEFAQINIKPGNNKNEEVGKDTKLD